MIALRLAPGCMSTCMFGYMSRSMCANRLYSYIGKNLHSHMHTHTHMYTHTQTYMHTHTHAYMHVDDIHGQLRTCMQRCTHAIMCLDAFVYICVHVYTHRCKHTLAYTNMGTRVCKGASIGVWSLKHGYMAVSVNWGSFLWMSGKYLLFGPLF